MKPLNEKIVCAIKSHNYKKAMDHLYKSSKGKKALMKTVKDTIRKEITAYLQRTTSLEKPRTLKNIVDFKWEEVFEETDDMPLLKSALSAAITGERSEKRLKA